MAIKADVVQRVAALCTALPEGEWKEWGWHFEAKVRDKVFLRLMDNHHGDGRFALWLKAPPGLQEELVSQDADVFFVPPYVGHRGWVGMRLDVGEIDWDEVEELMRDSYRLTAPKRLAHQVEG